MVKDRPFRIVANLPANHGVSTKGGDSNLPDDQNADGNLEVIQYRELMLTRSQYTIFDEVLYHMERIVPFRSFSVVRIVLTLETPSSIVNSVNTVCSRRSGVM